MRVPLAAKIRNDFARIERQQGLGIFDGDIEHGIVPLAVHTFSQRTFGRPPITHDPSVEFKQSGAPTQVTSDFKRIVGVRTPILIC